MKASSNQILNGVLALIRGNVVAAREIFRDPQAGIEDIPGVTAKVFSALDDTRDARAAVELTAILWKCMAMSLPPGVDAESAAARDFLRGVIAVEQIINERILEVSSRLRGEPDVQG